MEHLGLRVVLFSWSSDQVWAPGSLSGDVRLSRSVGQGHPGQWGVLVSDCLDLVWVQDLPSGVVLISGCLSLVLAPGSLSGVE